IDLPAHTVLVKDAKLTQSSSHSRQNDPSDDRFAEGFDIAVQSAVHLWLETHHGIQDLHLKARDAIITWLKRLGWSDAEINSLSGNPSGGRTVFLLSRTGLARLESPFRREAQLKKTPPVGLLLQEVRHLAAPITLLVVQHVDEKKLPSDYRIDV